ncbi:MAG TPA: hypothetical protein VJ890_15565, partial [Vineibacter sp.]|nr:hypothetical protein [Vineibacter sp.]
LNDRPRSGFRVLSLDLQDVQSGREFVERLIDKCTSDGELLHLLKAGGNHIRMLLERVKEVTIPGVGGIKLEKRDEATWQDVASQVIAALERSPAPLLFLFDEFPEMLRRIADKSQAEAEQLLLWFRSIRLQAKNEFRRHRFIVAGSTGLEFLLNRRLTAPGAINDLLQLTLAPLTPECATGLCRELAAECRFTMGEDAISHLLDLVGQPVPYFIQMLFSQLQQAWPKGKSPMTSADVDRVYRDRVQGRACQQYFAHYRTRLKRWADLEPVANQILAKIAHTDAPVPEEHLRSFYDGMRGSAGINDQFDRLMADLECDWYLKQTDDGYVFDMPIMRDWWRRWHKPHRTRAA